MSEPAAPTRYPLRVDVAKPAVMYQPSFGNTKQSPSSKVGGEAVGASAGVPRGGGGGGGSEGGSSGGGSGGGSGKPSERVLGKRRRAGRTEYLVKRPGSAESKWEPAKAVSAAAMEEFVAKRQSRQLLSQAKQPQARQSQAKQSTSDGAAENGTAGRLPRRILAQRRFEGGQRYLVHWEGMSVADASWESAKRLNNTTMVQTFENAVRAPFSHRARPGCNMPAPPFISRGGSKTRDSCVPCMQVKRARSSSEEKLRAGQYSLESLGFHNCFAFQGPSSV